MAYTTVLVTGAVNVVLREGEITMMKKKYERRNQDIGTLQEFQQTLLYTFTADIAGDGRIITLAGDLIDLVDINDTAFSGRNIVVTYL